MQGRGRKTTEHEKHVILHVFVMFGCRDGVGGLDWVSNMKMCQQCAHNGHVFMLERWGSKGGMVGRLGELQNTKNM